MKKLLSILILCVAALGTRAQQSWSDTLRTPLPDNVFEVSCSFPADSVAFDIQEKLSCNGVHSMSTPMVADLDGDGTPEIIACGVSNSSYWYGKNLLVFNSRTGQLIRTIYTNDYYVQGQCIAIADVDGDGHAELFVLESSGYIQAYRYNGTSYWLNGSTLVAFNYLLSIADIMGDGNVELVCGSYIFNAQNGTLLLNGTMQSSGRGFGSPNGRDTYSKPYYMYALADIDGDSTLEICAGNSIYKIDITNYSGAADNSWQLLRQADSETGISNYDGQTFVLDFDGDGDLDVGVIGTTSALGSSTATDAVAHTVNPYVWDGQTGNIIAYTAIDNSSATHRNYAPSIPTAADLDGNGTADILFSWKEVGLIRLTYDPSQSGNMSEMTRNTTYGGTVGATVFDFNNDGHNEIVLRGSDALNVIDGETLSPLCTPITAFSGTVAEYPVAADVEGDGEAEIVVTTTSSAWNGTNVSGSAKVYGRGSGGGAWSMARKVWNQWAYNSVNINEDLTVPQYPFDPATRFPNGTQPFNSFLCQMPYIDSVGNRFKCVADMMGSIGGSSISDAAVELSLSITNGGSASIDEPFGIAVYKDNYRGTLIYVDTLHNSLLPDSTFEHSLIISKSLMCSLHREDSIVIALNDFGIGVAQHGDGQEECDTINNFIKIAAPVYKTALDTAITACDSATWSTINWYVSQVSNITITNANQFGCDSTITVSLDIRHSNSSDTTAIVCDSFNWWGVEFTSSTTTSRICTNADGCDSVVTLDLTVNYSSNEAVTLVACDSLTWNGELRTESGGYTYTSQNAVGCDSSVTMNLTIHNSYSEDTTVLACDGFAWHDIEYNESGTYSYDTTTVDGCDSSAILHLTINHTSMGDTVATACDTMVWYGTSYTVSGDYQYLTTSQLPTHCDSIVTLHLTVNRFKFYEYVDSFCVGTTYYYAGEDVTQGGLYYDTVMASNGCDSVILLMLTMLTPPVVSISHDFDCPTQMHLLHANSTADHVTWSSSEEWPSAWGSPNSRSLNINVDRTVMLTLTADYNDYPTCSNSTSVTLQPIIQPEASMSVSPDFLTSNNLEFVAVSRSKDAEWLQWYIDGEQLGSGERMGYTAADDADSVVVTLVATTGFCADTTERTIYVRRFSFFAPNVFTPDEATNRTFSLFYNGVLECQLDIFSRQGLRVFQSMDGAATWDGTYHGIPCPQGAYVWLFRYRSAIDPQNWHTEKGTVTLIR